MKKPAVKAKIKKLNLLIFKQKVEVSDAVVWLQGDRYDRAKKVLEIYRENLAPVIVLSGNNILVEGNSVGKKIRPGEKNVTLDLMFKWLVRHKVNPSNIIVDPNSFNTYDQAVNVMKMAKKKAWKKLIIVGSWPYYQFRVFLTFLKASYELKWQGEIINQFAQLEYNDIPGGRKERVKELIIGEINKLERYKNNLVSIDEGINYLNK
jgi:uncharacterized SAM-binding protein YcdF (DUF218 family)